jgi:AbrB family looped-hinge helix DNA binding protein
VKATGIVRRIDDLGRVVIPKEIRRTLRIREGDPLEIFTDREGEVILKKYSPIDPNYITNRHADLLKKAGLPHVRFHDLRHSCVGLMMANEVPMERIRDWVGHSDIRTTVNTYGHLEYQSKKKTAKIIEKSLPLKKVEAVNL